MLQNLLKGAGKAVKTAGLGLLSSRGSGLSPLIKGAIGYAGYSTAAYLVDEYSKGFEHQSSKTTANVASFLLKAKGIHSGFQGATRQIGEIGYHFGNRYKGSQTAQWISGLTGSLRGPGQTRTMEYTGKFNQRYGFVNPGSHAFHNTPGVLKTGHYPVGSPIPVMAPRFAKRGAGSADKFISGLNPLTLPLRGAAFAASSLVKFPKNAVTGSVEYAKVYGNALRATKYHGGAAGWGTMALGLSEIKSPLSPVIAGGLAVGGANAFANRYQFGRNGLEESQYSAPITSGPLEGPVGGAGSIDPSNFPGGVTIGRGSSAIRSPTVMEGQAAVTSKMLSHRRV